jgi:ribosomal protein S27E
MPETKEDFVKAVDIKQKEMQNLRVSSNLVNSLWSRLGHITVQCPSCGEKQNVQSMLNVRCRRCHTSFAVVPKNKASQIVWCDPAKINVLHTLISLELDGKFPSI